jgi:hypothetical protein
MSDSSFRLSVVGLLFSIAVLLGLILHSMPHAPTYGELRATKPGEERKVMMEKLPAVWANGAVDIVNPIQIER